MLVDGDNKKSSTYAASDATISPTRAVSVLLRRFISIGEEDVKEEDDDDDESNNRDITGCEDGEEISDRSGNSHHRRLFCSETSELSSIGIQVVISVIIVVDLKVQNQSSPTVTRFPS